MKCKLCLMKVVDVRSVDVRSVFSGVLQGSLLGPPLYLIYINDLPDGITSLCKIFADDTLHFSKVHNISKPVNELNADLEKLAYGPVNGKCHSTLIPINKLFFFINLIQQTFSICLVSLTINVLVNIDKC